MRDPEAREALLADVAAVIRGRHGVEATVVLVPPHALPQTTSGKLSRSQARTLYLEGRFNDAASSAAAIAQGE